MGVIASPGFGITENLADKARGVGIRHGGSQAAHDAEFKSSWTPHLRTPSSYASGDRIGLEDLGPTTSDLAAGLERENPGFQAAWAPRNVPRRGPCDDRITMFS